MSLVKKMHVQAQLPKSSDPVTVEGVIFANISEAALHYGLQEKTVIARLKYGWSIDDAFKKPVRKW